MSKLLKVGVFFFIALVGVTYFLTLGTNFSKEIEPIISFNHIAGSPINHRMITIIYPFILVTGYWQFSQKNSNVTIKYKTKADYFKTYILKNIIIVTSVFTFSYFLMNTIRNYLVLDANYLQSYQFNIANFLDSLLLGLFLMTILFIYELLSIKFKNNLALVGTYIINFVCLIKILDSKYDTFVPHLYFSKLTELLESKSMLLTFGIYGLILLCFNVIFYFLVKELYPKKEFL